MYGLLTVTGKPLKDCATSGIGECFEKIGCYCLHTETITHGL
jgi:hypothetical protein